MERLTNPFLGAKKEVFEDDMGVWLLVKTHLFVYAGWNVIEEREYADPGTGWGLNRDHRFTWGTDLSGSLRGAGGVGGLLMAEEIDLADIDPPTAHYYWYDGNGNVTGITDDTGATEATYRYTSFGALAESSTVTAFASAQPWKFSSKYHDTEVEPVAGTYYYGYRHYLPSVGRWPSWDPIGESGGINLYGYLLNRNPNVIDRLGNEIFLVSGGPQFRSTSPPRTPDYEQVGDFWIGAAAKCSSIDLQVEGAESEARPVYEGVADNQYYTKSGVVQADMKGVEAIGFGERDKSKGKEDGKNNFEVVIVAKYKSGKEERLILWLWLPDLTFTSNKEVKIRNDLHLTPNPTPAQNLNWQPIP